MTEETTPLIINSSKEDRNVFSLNTVALTYQNSCENGWSQDNKQTWTTWINNLAQASFIYQYAKEVKKGKLTRLSLAAFILTGIATVAAGISSMALTADEQPYKTVALVVSVFVFCLNSGSTILNGIINKIYRLDETVEQYTKYIENIDMLYADLVGQNNISPNIRENASTFIQKQNSKYTTLIQKGPDVDPNTFEEGLKKFQDRIII